MKIAIGIPAYKAHETITECIDSINIQTMRDDINVIIANDNPGDEYSYLEKQFPKLHFTFLDCKENTGPGQARNRTIEASNDDFITFIDADDVFYTPFAIEQMYMAVNQPNVIQSQTVFVQPIKQNGFTVKLLPHVEPSHPWCFGRMTNVKFLKQFNIRFGTYASMEDSVFQHHIRLLTEGTGLRINHTQDISYLWKEGSEHSITRSGADVNNGIPIYNYGFCQIGAAIAFAEAIQKAAKDNPLNPNLAKFALESMLSKYFTYYECLEKNPVFAKENYWISQWFYHKCFKKYCGNLSDEFINKVFFQMFQAKSKDLSTFPNKSWQDWFDEIRNAPFDEEGIFALNEELPEAIREVEKKTRQVLTLDYFKKK